MKLLAMIQRVIIELLRDKRTLALMFLAPLLVLTLMYFIFNSDEDTTLNIGIADSVSTKITDHMKKITTDIYTIKEDEYDEKSDELWCCGKMDEYLSGHSTLPAPGMTMGTAVNL